MAEDEGIVSVTDKSIQDYSYQHMLNNSLSMNSPRWQCDVEDVTASPQANAVKQELMITLEKAETKRKNAMISPSNNMKSK